MLPLFVLKANPFFDAYTESDLLGKLIFIGLIILSVLSWSILIYKAWMISRIKKESLLFKKAFIDCRKNPLALSIPPTVHNECPNAFSMVYEIVKTKTTEILEKNSLGQPTPYLAPQDVSLLEAHAISAISSLTKYLEKHIYVLSTIVTLAPFLGLLGTVYGILVTFTELKAEPAGGTNQIILGGLSLALTTTVIGLIDAIPALIGYNYLKNCISDFNTEMDRFATEVLSSFELHYRKEL